MAKINRPIYGGKKDETQTIECQDGHCHEEAFCRVETSKGYNFYYCARCAIVRHIEATKRGGGMYFVILPKHDNHKVTKANRHLDVILNETGESEEE